MLGLFSFPILVLGLRGKRQWAAGTLGALVALGFAFGGAMLPFEGNIIIDIGMGPRSLAGPPVNLSAPPGFWLSLSALGGFGAGLITLRIATLGLSWLRAFVAERKPPERSSSMFWVALIAFGPTAIAYGAYFDRYLLLQLPLLVAFLASTHAASRADSTASHEAQPKTLPGASSPLRVAAASVLGLTFAYSIAVTHDYFGWQRARWELVDELRAEGVARTDIDGGFEVNNEGARAGDAFVESRPDATWLIAFDAADIEAPVTVRARPCTPWMPWAPDTVYALEVGD